LIYFQGGDFGSTVQNEESSSPKALTSLWSSSISHVILQASSTSSLSERSVV